MLDVLDVLRVQCPWDAKQTNESLRPNTIEETMELCDALINNSVPDIKKELGDVLLHILFYSIIANEKGQFDIADVCDAKSSSSDTRTSLATPTSTTPSRCCKTGKPSS